ncbi:MAG: Glu-tRNA(Gln) amidotransferase subunit GatE [Nitrososphaerales archaeon]
MSSSQTDPKEADVKVGLEIHQQLACAHKLFCECPILKSEELPLSFERRLRPAQSETGKLDPAAVFEFTKGRSNVYLWNPESSCLVEADEEPPHQLNGEALDIVLQIAGLLHSNVVDEVHVMRKIVIDGSNTTGFQRTAVIGLGGYLEVEGVRVGVQSVTIEEDAARIIGEDEKSRKFALDRLAVPLVEVALDPVEGSPEAVGRVALHLGRTLRSTGRVARGLGTIRQDLNVSVKGGKVVEVKGVQKLNLLPKVVTYEVARQLGLLALSSRLKKRGLKAVECRECDATQVLLHTASSVIQDKLREGGKVLCISAEGLGHLMGWVPSPGIRLGKEVAEVARANGLGGIIHSDEFAKQGISEDDEEALRRECRAGRDAALVLLAGSASVVEKAAPHVIQRMRQAMEGVPAETRSATEDGESRFMRPRPGAQRMYPETDVLDVVIGADRLDALMKLVPESWEETVERCERRYSLSRDLAVKLLDSGFLDFFENLSGQLRLGPSLVASMLVDLPVRLAREGIPDDALDQETIADVLRAIDAGTVAKEAAPEVLRSIGKGESKSVSEAVQKLGLSSIDPGRLAELIESVVRSNRALIEAKGEAGAFSPLMGEVMSKARGRADGSLVSRLLREKLASMRGGGKSG